MLHFKRQKKTENLKHFTYTSKQKNTHSLYIFYALNENLDLCIMNTMQAILDLFKTKTNLNYYLLT